MELDFLNYTSALWQNVGPVETSFVISPLSILTAFGMLLMGTRTHSESELKQALRIPSEASRSDIEKGFRKLMKSLNGVKEIKIANKLFTRQNIQMHKMYQSTLKKTFQTKEQKVDFSKPERAAKVINSWVEKATKNKIKDLVSSESIDQRTAFFLVNTVYFKDSWETGFSNIGERPFALLDGGFKSVSMMTRSGTVKYAATPEKINADVIAVPFKNNRFFFVIINPKEVDGIHDLHSVIEQNRIQSIMKALHSRNIVLTMPKFKIESKFNLKDVMSKLGAKSIFDFSADLSGMSNENLLVSDAIHKTYLRVDENGVEAAAATAIQVNTLSVKMSIKVNRPFICFIWDSKLEAISFIAQIASP